MISRFAKRRLLDGFSLIELLIVIAIMLLLAALALPRLLDAQKTAYQAGVVSFLRTLQSDQESYRLANGSYSDNFTDLGLTVRGPETPEIPFAQDEAPRLAALFPSLGPFHVYAAPSQQQPPAKTPPSEQDFGADPGKKQPGKSPGGPGGPGGAAGGGSGTTPPGKGGGSNPPPGKGPPGKGAGGGATPGGGASGGGTSGGAASGGQPGGTPPGGGQGGGFSPPSGGAPKTNIVVKHNYIFTLLRPTLTTWACTAAPVRDRGDSKFFFIDQTGVMRSELGKPASAKSPQI